jgi:type I restriction enzyme S subunit
MKGNNWEIVKLKEIAVIIMGQSPKSEFYNTNREGLPFFQGCSEFRELYPVPKKWCTKPLKIAHKDDVLMSVRAPVGDLNIADRKCIIGRGLCAIRTKLNSGRFLYYLLKGNIMEITSLGSGSVYAAINKSTIENLEIEIPSLHVQRKIAAILSAYDDLIENNTRRIKILEEMAETIYKEWFVKFHFPGHEKVKMMDLELGDIPEGWEVKRLGDVCIIMMGQSPSSKFYNTDGEGLPFHQGVKDFGTRFPTHKTYCTVDKRVAEKGDVLVSVRAPVGRINIANSKLIVGRGLAALRHESLLQSFLFYQLKNIFVDEDSMGGGSIFNAVTKEEMSDIKFLVPNESRDGKFDELVGSLDKQIEILYSQVENLKNTRDLLLSKLISGEIVVGV